MLIFFEIAAPPLLIKPFKFKGKIGSGKILRIGWLFFSVSIISKHDYMTYHKYINDHGLSKYKK